MNEIITSISNERIKEIKKLYDKKYREMNKKYIVEGIKIIEEAYLQKQNFENIVICQEMLDSVNIDKEVLKDVIGENSEKILYVDQKVFKTISDTQTPQGIIAVLKQKHNNFLCTTNNKNANILFLDSVQDPGNLGTIFRSARAFGFNTVILNKGCSDPYNPKVIRASMGNIFSLHILQADDEGIDTIINLKKNEYTIYGTTLKNSISIYDVVKFNDKKVLVVGNEANGIQKSIEELLDTSIVIPMLNQTESLNVAVATSIVMAQMARENDK